MDKKRLIAILILLMPLCWSDVVAQNVKYNEPLITLRGHVSCTKPEQGFLSGVTVINQDKVCGTLSDADGSFSIRMGKDDTIIFTTPQHEDYIYYLNRNVKFNDHGIEIIMEPDAVWLEIVTIVGPQSLEEFKNEILRLGPLKEDEINLILADLSKYAKQKSTDEGALVLTGSLSYLIKKFNRYQKLRSEIDYNKIKQND